MSCMAASSGFSAAASRAAAEPMNTSEWPPTYLVRAWQLMSTPAAIGLNSSPAPQVLSITVSTPRSRAPAAMAATSCISKLSDPGDSSTITRLLSPTMASSSAGGRMWG